MKNWNYCYLSGKSQHEAAVSDYDMRKLSGGHMFSVIHESLINKY